jgi:DNA polymerase elongation subunit (family B)
MGNVCSVPFGWIVARGQGVKIQSLVAKQCAERGFILPDLDKSKFGHDTFEGAIVLPPYPGLYLEEPVAVLDYASLYPSSMISVNLSHESYCDQPEWQGEDGAKRLEELGYDYEDVTYDTFTMTYTPSGLVKEKKKSGEKTVRFVQQPKGIIPQILENLLTARKETRKRMKHKTITYLDDDGTSVSVEGLANLDKEKDIWTVKGVSEPIPVSRVKSVSDTYSPFQKEVMDGQQLAYKITANSLYGQIGARTSYIYWKDIAAATTATGRKQLEIAQTYCEDESNFPQTLENGETIYLKNKVVYGDSVTGETPLLVRNRQTKTVDIIRIDDLGLQGGIWGEYKEFKPYDTNRREK